MDDVSVTLVDFRENFTIGRPVFAFHDSMDSMRRLYLLAKDTYTGVRKERCIKGIYSFPGCCSSMCTRVFQAMHRNSLGPHTHV